MYHIMHGTILQGAYVWTWLHQASTVQAICCWLVMQGNVFVNQYLVIKELGRGAHGSVKLVFDTEQQLVHAMKVKLAVLADRIDLNKQLASVAPAQQRSNSVRLCMLQSAAHGVLQETPCTIQQQPDMLHPSVSWWF